MPWPEEGSAEGEASQVGLEGHGEACGFSPESTGEPWQVPSRGRSGVYALERALWLPCMGDWRGLGHLDQGRDHRKGWRQAAEG